MSPHPHLRLVHSAPAEEVDELRAARGIFNGLAIALLFWCGMATLWLMG